MSRILGYGAVLSVVMSTFNYTGGSLRGQQTEVEGMDEYERKEYLRKNRRRPIEETIADLGEGRGMFPASSARPSRPRGITLYEYTTLLIWLCRNQTTWIRRAET